MAAPSHNTRYSDRMCGTHSDSREQPQPGTCNPTHTLKFAKVHTVALTLRAFMTRTMAASICGLRSSSTLCRVSAFSTSPSWEGNTTQHKGCCVRQYVDEPRDEPMYCRGTIDVLSPTTVMCFYKVGPGPKACHTSGFRNSVIKAKPPTTEGHSRSRSWQGHSGCSLNELLKDSKAICALHGAAPTLDAATVEILTLNSLLVNLSLNTNSSVSATSCE